MAEKVARESFRGGRRNRNAVGRQGVRGSLRGGGGDKPLLWCRAALLDSTQDSARTKAEDMQSHTYDLDCVLAKRELLQLCGESVFHYSIEKKPKWN